MLQSRAHKVNINNARPCSFMAVRPFWKHICADYQPFPCLKDNGRIGIFYGVIFAQNFKPAPRRKNKTLYDFPIDNYSICAMLFN